MSGGGCKPSCETDFELDDPEIAVVLRGPLTDVQRAAERLEARGIPHGIVRAGGGCGGGTMALAVSTGDVASAYAVLDEDWRRGLSPEQIAAMEASSRIVLDPDAAETTCPACLHRFDTGPSACPDCGLALG